MSQVLTPYHPKSERLSAKIFTYMRLEGSLLLTKKPVDKALYNIVRHRWNVAV